MRPTYDADHPPPFRAEAMHQLVRRDPSLRLAWGRHAGRIADGDVHAEILFNTYVLRDTAMIAEYARFLKG
jgi:hypothetical protein